MSSFLMTCNVERQVEDREWLLHLLIAGMRGPLDGDICRSGSLDQFDSSDKEFKTQVTYQAALQSKPLSAVPICSLRILRDAAHCSC